METNVLLFDVNELIVEKEAFNVSFFHDIGTLYLPIKTRISGPSAISYTDKAIVQIAAGA